MPDAETSDVWKMPPPATLGTSWRSGIRPWADAGRVEDLRDRSAVVRSIPPCDGAPFICQDGRFRSLHFSILHLQSEMDVRSPLRLTVDYTRVMMGFLLFQPAPSEIEMIGLGGGSLAKACHHLLPGAGIRVVEIAPEVIALRDHFLIPPDSRRFEIILGDGADFVRQDRSRPDVLLVDGFDRFGQPPRLCSDDFYRTCWRKLSPGGMMVVNLSGEIGEKSLYSRRISSVFENEVLSVGTEGGANRAVFAWKGRKAGLTDASIGAALERLGMDRSSFLASAGRRILRQVRRHESKPQNPADGRQRLYGGADAGAASAPCTEREVLGTKLD